MESGNALQWGICVGGPMLCLPPRGGAHVELDHIGYHNDGLRPITILEHREFQRVGTLGKQAPRKGLAGPGRPSYPRLSRPTRNRRCSDGESVEGGSDSVMILLSLSFRVRDMLTCSYRFERNAGAIAYGWH
jgi:hypothetical protein